MTSDLVMTEDAGHVRHIVLNRPDKRNAFNSELIAALGEAVRATAAAPDVHVVVLRGEGKMFSSGVDLQELASGTDLATLRPFRKAWLDVANALEELAKPVVCSIQGGCIGGALETALACDLRVMADDAVVGLPETRIGLIPDVGGSSRLPQVVGLGRAKELILTGALIGAERAEQIGLVNRVAPAAELEAATTAARGRAAGLRAHRRRPGQARHRRERASGALHHPGARDRPADRLRGHGGLQPRARRRSRQSANPSSADVSCQPAR